MPVFKRPAGAQLADLQAGDVVIVAKLDRLSRDAAGSLLVVKGWEESGVRLIINGWGDCIGPHSQGNAGRLMLEIMAVFAGHERRVPRQRQQEGQSAKRRAGGHIGGAAPFGFRKVGTGRAARLEPIAEQQDALRRMRALRAEGKSLRAIAAEMQAAGFSISHVTVGTALADEVRNAA